MGVSAVDAPTPPRHTSYASQVGYYLQQQTAQQQQQQEQHLQQQIPVGAPSGPRTNPSGYPGGPVVPSSGQPKSSQGPMAPTMGYTTTGRPSSHQQTMPMSFTRALEVSEALQQGAQPPQQPPPPTSILRNSGHGATPQQQPDRQDQQPQDGGNRDSVYDVNSYEISV